MADEDRCVMCGEIIHEGSQVCQKCAAQTKSKPTTPLCNKAQAIVNVSNIGLGKLVYVVEDMSRRRNGTYRKNRRCDTIRSIRRAAKNGGACIYTKWATDIDIPNIGSTVFLTKEEAERAIEQISDI